MTQIRWVMKTIEATSDLIRTWHLWYSLVVQRARVGGWMLCREPWALSCLWEVMRRVTSGLPSLPVYITFPSTTERYLFLKFQLLLLTPVTQILISSPDWTFHPRVAYPKSNLIPQLSATPWPSALMSSSAPHFCTRVLLFSTYYESKLRSHWWLSTSLFWWS